MKRKMVAFLAVILVSIVGITVIHNFDTRVSGQTTSLPDVNTNPDEHKAAPPSRDELPDRAFFDMLFNTVLSMEKAAANLKADGKNDDIWKHYFKRRGDLTDAQADVLRSVTAEFELAIGPVQNRALKLINLYRAARARGEKPSRISQRLRMLQTERDAISLRYGDMLRHRLGLPIIDKLREVINQTQSNSTSVPESNRQELMESFRQLRQQWATQTNAQQRGGDWK